jgi:hypothetical protein
MAKQERFVTVGEIFFKVGDGTIGIPPGAEDRDIDTPQLRSVDGKEKSTVAQIACAVNAYMYHKRTFPNSHGREEAEEVLRKFGASDEDIHNLLD